MDKNELLQDLTAYLKAKYSREGIAVADQTDGCTVSGVSIILKDNGEEKIFKLTVSRA